MLKSESQYPMNILVVGNPGVGKSTTLNMLTQTVKFNSGISLGAGLTSVLQEEFDDKGIRLIDTPGLSDIIMREQAAQEIKQALQKDGFYKILFVITLEAGRIRSDDKATIQLILESVKVLHPISYSVIINKVPPEVMKFLEDQRKTKEFIDLLNEGLPGTNSFFFNPFDPALDGKQNQLAPLTSNFTKFISDVSASEIKPEKVTDIKIDEFKLRQGALETEIRNHAFRTDDTVLRQVI